LPIHQKDIQPKEIATESRLKVLYPNHPLMPMLIPVRISIKNLARVP